jgi:hypothetical protein
MLVLSDVIVNKKRSIVTLLVFLLTEIAFAGSQHDLIFSSGFERLFTVAYTAGTHGSISGISPQTVEQGSNATPVTALADVGYHFVNWSDASVDNPRIDTKIHGDIAVTANFFIDIFGLAGSHTVAPAYQESTELATIFFPSDASVANKVPVVFFAPGWGSTDPHDYEILFNFIASHGYAVIYARDEKKFTSMDMLVDFLAMVNDPMINPLLDTTRIGVIGHSIGGGHVFSILDKLSDSNGFGANGRFAFAIEPWFAFDMMQLEMRTLPGNTNVVIQQYGTGGFNNVNATDPRIPLTEYYLLESIADSNKDYQVHENADHNYPTGAGTDYSSKHIILAPLDALMEYTFVNSSDQVAHDTALELGNDDPYADGKGIQIVFPRGDMRVHYPCNGYTFTDEDIDFCDIEGYPYSSKFTPIATNAGTIKPGLLGSSTDLEFGTTITRLTKRVNQNDIYNGSWDPRPRGNHHPYPKTPAWNADMTMLRMNYRIYDANTFQEIPLTTGNSLPLTTQTNDISDLYHINGELNEKKWSTQDPGVFYGVYLSWDKKGQFWKGTIDRNAQAINYSLIKSFGNANSYELFSLGKYEGNISFDDNFVVLAARKIGVNYLTAIIYDKQNNTFVEKDFDGNNGNAFIEWTDPPATQVFDWISVSPLGHHVLISTDGTVQQYDMNLNFVRQLASSAGHGDMGLAQNGDEVYVQYEYGADIGVWVYRLSDGFRHQLLPDKYNGGHVSCRNYQRPGWCYLSTKQETHREVFALRINFADHSKHVVNRFAQTHTRSIDAAGNTMNSLGGVSPDGKRVIFYTDWEDVSLDYYDRDTYQARKME